MKRLLLAYPPPPTPRPYLSHAHAGCCGTEQLPIESSSGLSGPTWTAKRDKLEPTATEPRQPCLPTAIAKVEAERERCIHTVATWWMKARGNISSWLCIPSCSVPVCLCLCVCVCVCLCVCVCACMRVFQKRINASVADEKVAGARNETPQCRQLQFPRALHGKFLAIHGCCGKKPLRWDSKSVQP